MASIPKLNQLALFFFSKQRRKALYRFVKKNPLALELKPIYLVRFGGHAIVYMAMHFSSQNSELKFLDMQCSKKNNYSCHLALASHGQVILMVMTSLNYYKDIELGISYEPHLFRTSILYFIDRLILHMCSHQSSY